MIFRTLAFPLQALLETIFQMKPLKHILLIALFAFISNSCDKQTDDGFPKTRFTGFFNISLPPWSGDSFSATRDMDYRPVGLAGIIVYRASANEYYAFERMCPHEKKFSCTVNFEKDHSIVKCECCGSRFLILGGYGDKLEGPAEWPLKRYRTSVSGNTLMVSAP